MLCIYVQWVWGFALVPVAYASCVLRCVSLAPHGESEDTRYLEEIGVFKASDNIAIDH